MKKIICPLTCPMINAQGFCESAWKRVEHVRECPHNVMRERVSKLDARKPKGEKRYAV